MMESIQVQILCNESNWQHINISPENMKKTIQYLKGDKADGVVDLVSNNFINGPDCMIMYLVSCLKLCCCQQSYQILRILMVLVRNLIVTGDSPKCLVYKGA